MSGVLQEDERERICEQVAEAVFAGPAGLREALEIDAASYLRLIAAANAAAGEGDRLLRDAVGGARRAGHSWDAIGGILGVSRQAAQQRFRTAAETAEAGPSRRVLTNVQVFNEMGLLADEGRHGFHLVDFGAFFLIVEASPRQWEHRRLIAPLRSTQRRMEEDGWEQVGSWYGFRYYKRPLDAAAEPRP